MGGRSSGVTENIFDILLEKILKNNSDIIHEGNRYIQRVWTKTSNSIGYFQHKIQLNISINYRVYRDGLLPAKRIVYINRKHMFISVYIVDLRKCRLRRFKTGLIHGVKELVYRFSK